jgi:predicted acyl esterase
MTYEPQRSTEIQEFRKEQYEVIFRQLKPPDDSEGSYPGFAPGLTVKNGIRAEYEVAVPMRDGTIIYADIFRPDDVNNIPAIIS